MSKFSHPYIPNSQPDVKKSMLDYLNMESAEDIYKVIPSHLRFDGELDLPEAFESEYEMRKHVIELLNKNKNAMENLSFLGGGTWNHYVPSVVDTIASRDEFLTAYVGDAYSDHGKFQALFEFASMIGDLTDMDFVGNPTYDWGTAIGIALRMAVRMKDRSNVIVPDNIGPNRYLIIENYVGPFITIDKVKTDKETGRVNIDSLKELLNDNVAAVYIENPNYFGNVEIDGQTISDLVHKNGSEFIVGADPSSLGIFEAPANYGADITVGELQPLGIHMQYGGGLAGYVATRDEEEYVEELPMLVFGIASTDQEGEYGFGSVYYDRTSYASREKAKDFVGTATALYGISAAVYLSLMGPHGMKELGESILSKTAYLKQELSKINGVKIPHDSLNFKEVLVNFDNTGHTVDNINKILLERDIFGGINTKQTFPEYGESALFAVTEITSKKDIDRLCQELSDIVTS